MNPAHIIVFTSIVALLSVPAQAHPDKVEDRLLLHFATGGHPPQDGTWQDLTHQFTADVKGAPVLTNIGPALALRLDGSGDHLRVQNFADRLPAKEFTVAAWVILNDTHPDGG